MKTLLAIILTAGLAFLSGEFLPWWSIAIAAFAASLFIGQSPFASFFGGFVGIFSFWAGCAFWIDKANQSILSERVAFLFPLEGNPLFLILFTGLVGGLVGGFAALSANFLVRPGKKVPDSQNYYQKKLR